MQITNAIQIRCSYCGAEMPIETDIGREYERNLWIFRVMPCVKCKTCACLDGNLWRSQYARFCGGCGGKL